MLVSHFFRRAPSHYNDLLKHPRPHLTLIFRGRAPLRGDYLNIFARSMEILTGIVAVPTDAINLRCAGVYCGSGFFRGTRSCSVIVSSESNPTYSLVNVCPVFELIAFLERGDVFMV